MIEGICHQLFDILFMIQIEPSCVQQVHLWWSIIQLWMYNLQKATAIVHDSLIQDLQIQKLHSTS